MKLSPQRLAIAAGGLMLTGLAAWYARAASATAVIVTDNTPTPKTNPVTPTYAPSSPNQTSLQNAALHSSGWVPWRGLLVTAVPLVDTSRGDRSFARLSYDDAQKFADSQGAMLLTTQIVDGINDEGVELNPEPLELVRNAYDASHLQDLSYDTAEDTGIWKQLDALGWDGKTPVGNGWKDWIRGAPSGSAYNYGWRSKTTGKYAQSVHVGPSATPHNGNYFDYSQLTRLVKGA